MQQKMAPIQAHVGDGTGVEKVACQGRAIQNIIKGNMIARDK